MTCTYDRTAAADGRAGRRARAVVLLLAFAVAAFCLWPLARNPGFWNPDELELLDAQARGLPAWTWNQFARFDGLFYRPLGFALFGAQLAIGGDAPAVHWLSLLHHLGNALLCALVFRRSGVPALAGAAVLVLPSAVEGIAWVAAVYDRAALSFALLAALALQARGARCLAALPCYALALCCKETAVVFPAIAALVLWSRPDRGRSRWPMAAAAAVTLLAGLFGLFRVLARADDPEYALRPELVLSLRLPRYLLFALSPTTPEAGLLFGAAWWPALAAAAVIGLAARGRQRLLAAGLVSAAAPLLPVLALPRMQGNYNYLAAPGLALVLAAAFARPTPRLRVAAAAVVAVILCVHTRLVADYYRECGAAMHALRQRFPPTAAPSGERDPVRLACAPGPMRGIAERYAWYLDHVGSGGLLPVDFDDPTAALTLVDGRLQAAPATAAVRDRTPGSSGTGSVR